MNAKRKSQRQLGLITGVSIVIANMIGTGIFTTTGFLAEDIGSVYAIMIAWILGGIVALCGALTYAELATAIPESGGEYIYLSRLYHPSLGFLSGWVSLFAGFSAPIAAAAVAFGKYIHILYPSLEPMYSAIGLVCAFTIIHLMNVKLSSAIQNLITIFKTALIIGFVFLAWMFSDFSYVESFKMDDVKTLLNPAFAVGLIFVMYAYSGWNSAAYIAGEVRNPKKNLPLSLLIGTGLVILIYISINWLYLSLVPLEAISGKLEVANIVAYEVFGKSGAQWVTMIILLALITSVSGMTMAGSRVYQALGKDYSFFSFLGKSTKTQSPFAAILLQSFISLILILSFSFDSILYYTGFTLSLFMALSVFGIFILRYRAKSKRNTYRTWAYPFTPVLFLMVNAWMLWHTFFNQTKESLIGLATLVLGLIVYYVLPKNKTLNNR